MRHFYASEELDRVAHLRGNEDWLGARLDDPAHFSVDLSSIDNPEEDSLLARQGHFVSLRQPDSW